MYATFMRVVYPQGPGVWDWDGTEMYVNIDPYLRFKRQCINGFSNIIIIKNVSSSISHKNLRLYLKYVIRGI